MQPRATAPSEEQYNQQRIYHPFQKLELTEVVVGATDGLLSAEKANTYSERYQWPPNKDLPAISASTNDGDRGAGKTGLASKTLNSESNDLKRLGDTRGASVLDGVAALKVASVALGGRGGRNTTGGGENCSGSNEESEFGEHFNEGENEGELDD